MNGKHGGARPNTGRKPTDNTPTTEVDGRTARVIDLPVSAPIYSRRLIPLGDGCYKRAELRPAA